MLFNALFIKLVADKIIINTKKYIAGKILQVSLKLKLYIIVQIVQNYNFFSFLKIYLMIKRLWNLNLHPPHTNIYICIYIYILL